MKVFQPYVGVSRDNGLAIYHHQEGIRLKSDFPLNICENKII